MKTLAEYRAGEGALVRETLERHGWSLRAAAEALDVAASTLQGLIKAHGLSDEYERRKPKRGRPATNRGPSPAKGKSK